MIEPTTPNLTVAEETPGTMLLAVAERALIDRLSAIELSGYLGTLASFRHYARVAAPTTPALDPEISLRQSWLAERLVRTANLSRSEVVHLVSTGTGQLADQLRAELLPTEVVEALARAVASGRTREKRRLAAYPEALASVQFAPRVGREGQLGYTRKTIRTMVQGPRLLLNCLVEIAADELYEDIEELKRWRTKLDAPKIRTHRRAGSKESLTPPVDSVIEQIAYYDEILGGVFRRRFNISDLELSHERWLSAFPTDQARRNWVLQSGIVDAARKRALVAVGVETTLRSIGLHDLLWSGFTPEYHHSALTGEKGADQVGGAVLAIAIKSQPARPKPISPHAVQRVLVYRWILEALIAPAGLDDYPDLSMWCRVDRDRIPHSFGDEAINDLFGVHRSAHANPKNPHKYVLCPMDPRAVRDVTAPRQGTGHHGLRRAGDQMIFDYFDRWKKQNGRIRPGLEGVHVKEGTLDHERIPGDVLGYTGLSGEPARLLLSYYGSRTIAGVVYEGLSLPRGRDEQAIRAVFLDLKAVNDVSTDIGPSPVEHNLDELDERSEDVRYLQDSLREAKRIAVDEVCRLARRNAQLVLARAELERRLNRLTHDEETWVVLPRGMTQISTAQIEEFRTAILAVTPVPQAPPPARNFLLQREVADVMSVSTETLRRQRKNDPHCDANRFYPKDSDPVADLDERTPLYHIGAFYEHLLTPDRVQHAERLLAAWPEEPAWQPGGAKRRKLEARGAMEVNAPRLNPLAPDGEGSTFIALRPDQPGSESSSAVDLA